MKKINIIILIIFIGFILTASFSINKGSYFFEDKEISIKEIGLFKPLQIKKIDNNHLSANILSSVLIKDNQPQILFEKELNKKAGIASITKLMTAVIVIDKYPLDSKIEVNEEMLNAWGTAGGLQIGEHVNIKDLLYIMLIESSNDAAECLASKVGRENFIHLMNEKAKGLKMKNTEYFNPSGLDEDDGTYNTSSAKDLTILVSNILEDYPIIAEILSNKTYYLTSEEGYQHKLTNTNKLLKEFPYKTWGKTGYTEMAKECLILMTRNENNDIIVNTVIGSDDRFTDMDLLINSVNKAFNF